MSYKGERQHRAEQATKDSPAASHLAPGSMTLVEAQLGGVQRTEQPHDRQKASAPAQANGSELWSAVDGLRCQPGETVDAFSDVIQGIGAAQRSRATAAPSSAPVQAKSETGGGVPDIDPRAGAGAGQPLDPSVRLGMGSHFDADFSSVRVHTDGNANAACEAAGARALTQGSDIYFRAGAYQPGSNAGRELLGHELAHVVQQSTGRASGLAGKAADGSTRDALEAEADAAGAAAAAAMASAPIDWALIDQPAFEAAMRQADDAGAPVPVAKDPAAAKNLPAARQLARRAAGGKPIAKSNVGPQQAAKDANYAPTGIYNQVEVKGINGLQFLELDPVAGNVKYELGPHLNAVTRGYNSRRDGNFGLDHKGPTGAASYGYNDFKSANWSYVTQALTGGAGTHTLRMHNWAFDDIEAAESFEVVPGVVSVKAAPPVTGIPAMDAKIPVMFDGDATVEITQSQVVKNTHGWTAGHSIGSSTTITQGVTLGLSAGLEQKDAWKVGAEGGISSSNTQTVWKQVQSQAGGAKTNTHGQIVGQRIQGPARQYVYPTYNAFNYIVTAYPHDDRTAKVTGKPTTVTATFLQLAKLKSIGADEAGHVVPDSRPDPAADAEDRRIAKEKKGTVAPGKRLRTRLVAEDGMMKDYDNQRYTDTLPGGNTQVIGAEWGKEASNSFAVTDSGGVKVSSSWGWSLGLSVGVGGAGKDSAGPSAGAKIGISELTTSAAEHGDVNAASGGSSTTETFKYTVTITGTRDPKKMTQVILTPILHEKLYAFDAWNSASKTWETVPARARSRTYQPVPAVTKRDLPLGAELKPEAKPKLDPQGVDKGADHAKKLRKQRDKETDPAKRAQIDAQIEGKLAAQREALEEAVRKAHPSLEVIDRRRNLYRITVAAPNSANQSPGNHQQPFVGTLESLMDFTPRSPAVQNAADALATHDGNPSDGAAIRSQAGLGGTAAQGRANPSPGDVDLSETIKIAAPTADAAAAAFAASIQQTVRTATRPRQDGKLGYVFLGMMVGVYPSGAKAEGTSISWQQEDVMAGSKSFMGKDGKSHTITLAQAIASVQNRAANTYWRGPIDAWGTYGEITKVLSYEAVTSAGDALFSTPRIGQGYQEVGFGDHPLREDTERAKLLDALTPQVAEYAKAKMWVKALKRAYTVARMLNDLKALNDFAALTRGEQATLKSVSDHTAAFNEDIANPQGRATGAMSAATALDQARRLSVRIHALDAVGPKIGVQMDRVISAAGDDIRGKRKAYDDIARHVISPLERALEGDKEYATAVASVLRAHGYLGDK